MKTANPPIHLIRKVSVRPNSTRSINVEQDIERPEVAENHILTDHVRRSLEQVIAGSMDRPRSRAWTFTGPYGSGKSYFGLFLMNLLSKSLSGHGTAVRRLEAEDDTLSERVSTLARLDESYGLLPVPITGYRISLHACILEGLKTSLLKFAGVPEIDDLLQNDEIWSAESDGHGMVQTLVRVMEVVESGVIGYSGLLIVLDEMGKPLEYAASHPERSDLYVLQELAELANRTEEAPLLFVGILHQSFDRYAGGLDSVVQREWDKIQGRFQDVAFQESPAQQIKLIANAIEHAKDMSDERLAKEINRQVVRAIDAGWAPAMMGKEEFRALANASYPFHPTTLAALPYFFRRLAQNERSLFAYLASQEPKGFQEFLATHVVGDFVRLPDLFDYLVANMQGRLYASLRARPITEALEHLQRLDDSDTFGKDVVKSLGLLGWLSEVGPFRATETALYSALANETMTQEVFAATLASLKQNSFVVHRGFSGTFALWQGSDVDIEARTQEARRRISSSFSAAEAVKSHLPPQPLIAQRHSFKKGALRYFDLLYVDKITRDSVRLTTQEGSCGLVLVCLASGEAEVYSFEEWARAPLFQNRADIVVGVAQNSARLVDLLTELEALNWVRDNTPELRSDAVARREIRLRISDLRAMVQNDLETSLRLHGASGARSKWFYRGTDWSDRATRGVSHLLSEVADWLMSSSPTVRNEIVNRRVLSSQGAAARRNLIQAMIERPEIHTLGITGYPPERSMYESILRAGGLHRLKDSGEWEFGEPPDNDPLGFHPVWKAFDQFVFGGTPEPRRLTDLFTLLSDPPFGVTAGLAPVLLCAFLQTYRDEVTLYREGTLLIDPAIADWEVLLRRPDLFAVAGCRIEGTRLAVVERIAMRLQTNPAVVPIVKELIRRLKSLPEYAWRTQRLSKPTIAFRRAIEQARSPETLLFDTLPRALELPPLGRTQDEEAIAVFFARLNDTLQELSNCTPEMIVEARDYLLGAMGLAKGEGGWREFSAISGALIPYVKAQTLLPLLRRAADEGQEQIVLESALAYVGERPPKNWGDGDLTRFRSQATVLGEMFQREREKFDADALLTVEERLRAVELAAQLQELLNGRNDARQVVLAALRMTEASAGRYAENAPLAMERSQE